MSRNILYIIYIMSCINKKSINNNIDSLCIISTGSNNKSKKNATSRNVKK